MGVYNKDNAYYIPFEVLKNNPEFLTKVNIYTYDYKKVLVALKKQNITVDRKILAELAISQPAAFKAIVAQAKKEIK